jgi:hypothetical protein
MRKGVSTGAVAQNRIELRGQKFGKLTALESITVIGEVLKYRCACDCGNEIIVRAQSLRTGNTKSCGCGKSIAMKEFFTRHGMSRTPIHNVWMGMRRRCEDPKSKYFSDYGGRGITVCERWQTFENFLEDMGIPEKGMTLERSNNDLGYSKENCIWATKTAQANNRRSSKIIEFNGKSQTQAEWEKELGLRSGQIYERLSRGWSFDRALLTPRGTPGGVRLNSGRKPMK